MRKILSLVLIICLALGISAVSAQAAPVEITFWHSMGGVNGEAIAKMTEDFNTAY